MKIANEVNEDADKTIRLRFCPAQGVLRLDTYREPGRQEFCGEISEIVYTGDNIPGDVDAGVVKPEVKPRQTMFALSR